MATFRVTDKETGSVFNITSQDDTPPSEQELNQIFEEHRAAAPEDESFLSKVRSNIAGGVQKTIGQLTSPEAREQVGPAGEFVSKTITGVGDIATAGIPRALLKQEGVDVPRGGLIGQTAGLFGAGNLIRDRLIKAGLKTTGRKGILTGAIEGGATSQLIAPEEGFFNPLERGIQLGIGTLAGPAVELGIGTKRAVERGTRKFFDPPKKTFQERAAGRKVQIESGAQQKLDIIKNRVDSQNQIIDDLVAKTSRGSAVQAQQDLGQAFKAGKDQYQRRLTAISKELDDAGVQFTKKDVDEMIQETIDEAGDLFLDEGGAPIRLLNRIKDKINKVDDVVPDVGVSALIKATKKAPKKAEVVKLEELLKIKRAVDAEITSGVQRGTTFFTSDDIVSAIFNRRMGERIAAKSDSFRPLQQSYGELVERMKDAQRIFKISKGSTQTGTAETFIQKAAKGKARGGELEAIGRLEAGGELAPGVRPIVEPTRQAERARVLSAETGRAETGAVTKTRQRQLNALERRAQEQRSKTRKRAKGGQAAAATGAAFGTAATGLFLAERARRIGKRDQRN